MQQKPVFKIIATAAIIKTLLAVAGPMVVTAFATLQSSCLACHQSFRKPFLAHFYG